MIRAIKPSTFRRRAAVARECSSAIGFTLIELLMVIAIIALMASALLVALAGAKESARVARARAQIARIHEILIERWEWYQTRPLPVRVPVLVPPVNPAAFRLAVVRELMRMEMPDRKSDVEDGPSAATLIRADGTALWQAYKRRVLAAGGFPSWSVRYQGAECLYMILATIQDGDSNGLSFFSQAEIGDLDEDEMPEILDPWGQPIEFLRWPAGLQDSELNDVDIPDPFDMNQTDPRFNDPDLTNDPFILMPLILSSGPDEQYGIVLDDPDPLTPLRYRLTAVAPFFVANDPYVVLPAGQIGVRNGGGDQDNIHNHQDLSE